MAYKHLSQQERYTIAIYRKHGWSSSRIASELQRDPTTIRRELRRNRNGDDGFDAETAHRRARERQHQRSKQPWKMTDRMRRQIVTRLAWGDSPDVIAGRCKRNGVPMVSTEWIYALIYRDGAAGGSLWKYLERKHKRRLKRGRKGDGRGQIPNRTMIGERPPEVDARTETGHWEGDSLMGRRNASGLLSLIERRSRFVRLRRPSDRTAEQTADRMIEVFTNEVVLTITLDNGKEFADHERIAHQTASRVYFAEPYSPWQRGSIENINRLIRRFFPKGTDFTKVRDVDIAMVEHRLNNRPRKLLGYATPWEVYSGKANPPPERAL